MKILANDGISQSGINELEKEGFEVLTTTVAQEQLVNFINENEIVGLLVRSATKVRTDIIDNCPSLKLIGRGGVGMDNIDVAYAKEKGLHVINTPAASSESPISSIICPAEVAPSVVSTNDSTGAINMLTMVPPGASGSGASILSTITPRQRGKLEFECMLETEAKTELVHI